LPVRRPAVALVAPAVAALVAAPAAIAVLVVAIALVAVAAEFLRTVTLLAIAIFVAVLALKTLARRTVAAAIATLIRTLSLARLGGGGALGRSCAGFHRRGFARLAEFVVAMTAAAMMLALLTRAGFARRRAAIGR